MTDKEQLREAIVTGAEDGKPYEWFYDPLVAIAIKTEYGIYWLKPEEVSEIKVKEIIK